LALALDESRDCDTIYPVDEFEFVIDKELSTKLGNVEVDFSDYGFNIKTEHALLDAGKDCSGCSCKS
jgi:Fe-S cluster assembly iron-binding protein IscA